MWIPPAKIYSLVLIQHFVLSSHAFPLGGQDSHLGAPTRGRGGRGRGAGAGAGAARKSKSSGVDGRHRYANATSTRSYSPYAVRRPRATMPVGRPSVNPDFQRRAVGGPGNQDVFVVSLADGYDMTNHLRWLSSECCFISSALVGWSITPPEPYPPKWNLSPSKADVSLPPLTSPSPLLTRQL